jgi:enoyl-[acyl-carrier protein] reductase II
MLRTPLCTLLGIEFPIIQAGMGAFTSAELAAAVSNAGGLGSVGTFLRPVEDLPQQLARLRELTSRPFGGLVNRCVNGIRRQPPGEC